MEGSRAVAETPTQRISMAGGSKNGRRGGRERRIQEFESTEHQAKNTEASVEESRMDDEGEEGDELKSSAVPNTRPRIATTSLEEKKCDERVVAVTTQEWLDGIHEKSMRIASLDELEESSDPGRWSSSGRAENDRNKKVNEIAKAFVGLVMKGGDIIVASGSKSKQWKDMSLKRAIQDWNMKYVDVAISPGSALRVFTSSE